MRILLVLILIAAAGAGAYFYGRQVQTKPTAETAVTPTAKVERGAIKQSVFATGRMVSNLDVDIKCKASGEVTSLPFDISDTVKKGDLLLELDPIDEKRAKDLAEAQLASANARLAAARQNLLISEMKVKTDRIRADASVIAADTRSQRSRIKAERLKGALQQSAATQEDYDTAEAEARAAAAEADISRAQVEELKSAEAAIELRRQDVKLAELAVKSDEVALAIVQQRLDETKVHAPMDGVVAARAVQKGQIIASAISNVGGGTTVMTISDVSRVFSMASVDESDIGNIKKDQDVIVTADAYSGRVFKGKVNRIATRGANVSNVVTFEVKIEITDHKKTLLKPEMTTNVEIVIGEKSDVLLVPSESVVHRKGEKFVSVQNADGTTVERKVEAGINDGTKIEISSGLEEGESVVIRKATSGRWAGGARPPGGGFNPLGGGGRPR